MKYLLSIWLDESLMTGRSEEEARGTMAAYDAFTGELRAADAYLGGEGLVPTAAAQTLRIDDGERQVTDGPLAKTKERAAPSPAWR